MESIKSLSLLALVAFASADPVVWPRAVSSIDEAAAARAQQRDDTATRALSNTRIRTLDGKCLFVDKLSGDFRENLTPVQVADCGSTDGQGWDVITDGKHINVGNSMLIVSTLTNACIDFDPRGPSGSQVALYSCGGSPDGSGSVTASQIFPLNGISGPLSLQPRNGPGKCLAASGHILDVAACSGSDLTQKFIFEGDGTAVTAASTTTTAKSATTKSSTAQSTMSMKITNAPAATSTGSVVAPNSTVLVRVSGAGRTLNPSAVAEAHQRDDTATRAFSSVSIRTSNGRCLSVDHTAGDFRENLIPVSLIDCKNAISPNAMWDIVTKGKHNDGRGGTAALFVSQLTQGCISYDYRREDGDKVVLFSCGGRADGSGSTNTGQLFPFTGERDFELAPVSEGNTTCIIAGRSRLDSGPCAGGQENLFSVFNH